MDPRRDIDASGNRVVNVANPSLGHHAATKTYVDTTTLLVHYRDPQTSSEEYVRYINLRNHTAHSLVALCKISLDWDWTTEHDKNAVGPHILLETTTSTSISVRPSNGPTRSCTLNATGAVRAKMSSTTTTTTTTSVQY